MGDSELDPSLDFAPGGGRLEVEVTGGPSSLTGFQKLHPRSVAEGLKRNPGIVVTALHCVNAIAVVRAASPCLAIDLDLPMVSGRASQPLHRNHNQAAAPQ